MAGFGVSYIQASNNDLSVRISCVLCRLSCDTCTFVNGYQYFREKNPAAFIFRLEVFYGYFLYFPLISQYFYALPRLFMEIILSLKEFVAGVRHFKVHVICCFVSCLS